MCRSPARGAMPSHLPTVGGWHSWPNGRVRARPPAARACHRHGPETAPNRTAPLSDGYRRLSALRTQYSDVFKRPAIALWERPFCRRRRMASGAGRLLWSAAASARDALSDASSDASDPSGGLKGTAVPDLPTHGGEDARQALCRPSNGHRNVALPLPLWPILLVWIRPARRRDHLSHQTPPNRAGRMFGASPRDAHGSWR